ncbi:MAG TPA: GNAT family N-acetyltransferase [Gemmatimonadaceae bacterium]|nr:GNAT family N-acetyltransferase [Gemmatimonadaceae bacterium]
MTRVVPASTPRLRFREIEPTDLGLIAEMMSNADVMRFYPKLFTRVDAAAWIQRQRARYAADGHGLWIVEELSSGALVGQVGLLMQTVEGFPAPRYPEIGYLLHRPFWKRGLATEAAIAVRAYAFDLMCYDEVISLIRPVNLPSQAVARRLGMTVRGRTAFHDLEHLVFGISRASYESSAR